MWLSIGDIISKGQVSQDTVYILVGVVLFAIVVFAVANMFSSPECSEMAKQTGIAFQEAIDKVADPSYPTYSGGDRPADTDENGCVEIEELITFIERWKTNSQDVTMQELIEAIGIWKGGC